MDHDAPHPGAVPVLIRVVPEGTAVCRRSGINPPSLFARVDGKAGLFAAVYDRGMAEVHATEDLLFDQLPRADASLAEQATDTADAIAEVVAVHARFLRPVISRAEYDPQLLERGAAESRRLLQRVANAIGVDPVVGDEIARTALRGVRAPDDLRRDLLHRRSSGSRPPWPSTGSAAHRLPTQPS